MIRKIQATQAGWGVAVLRVTLGMLFFREGAMKLFGWFGGSGFAGTCAYFRQLGIPFPEFNAVWVGGVELLGGTALLVGYFTRLASVPIGATMVVAVLTAHLGGGWSYPILIIACCAVLLQAGSGPLSVDAAVSKKS